MLLSKDRLLKVLLEGKEEVVLYDSLNFVSNFFFLNLLSTAIFFSGKLLDFLDIFLIKNLTNSWFKRSSYFFEGYLNTIYNIVDGTFELYR